jgi:hypothetical protein
MQNIDKQILNRLIDHFEEMDFDGTRMLVIGLHIPSKQQAEEMKLEIKNTNMTLKEAWEIKKKKLMQDLGYDENNKLVNPVYVSKDEVEKLKLEVEKIDFEVAISMIQSSKEMEVSSRVSSPRQHNSAGSSLDAESFEASSNVKGELLKHKMSLREKLKHKAELIRITNILLADDDIQTGEHVKDEIDAEWLVGSENDAADELEEAKRLAEDREAARSRRATTTTTSSHYGNVEHLLKLDVHFKVEEAADWFSHPFGFDTKTTVI